MLLSPLAQRIDAQARRHDLEREAQVHRARRIARQIVEACCSTDATGVDGVDRTRPLRLPAWLAPWNATKAGA